MLFLQNCVMIFKEATRNADEVEHAAPELFRVGVCDKTSAAKIMT